MGLGDNRRSPKMRRLISQRKKKARVKRRRAQAAEARAPKGAPAKTTGKKK
jgi:hypothetical protein